MDVTVQVISLHLAEALPPGRYNLHCSAQTHEGGFVSSSILELNEEKRIIEGNSSGSIQTNKKRGKKNTPKNEEWMRFTYTFQHPHSTITLFMKLTDLSVADNQIELARSLLPLSFKPELGSEPQIQHRPAFLTSSLQDLPVTEHIGRLMLTATATYKGKGGGGERSQELSNELTWIDLESTQEQFPLMNVRLAESQIAFGRSEETLNSAGTANTHALMHVSDILTFPQKNGAVLTVMFHCFATEDTLSTFQPMVKQDPADERINSAHQHPFAVWNVEQTHNRAFQYSNILMEESQFVTQDIFSLHLFKSSRPKPIFSAYENVCELLPFFYTHRCWLLDIDKPTLLTDPLMKAGKHIVTSLSYTPPVSTYTKFNGLELAVMRVKTSRDEMREFVLTVEIVYKGSTDDSSEPLFLRQVNSLLTDRKIALLQTSSESQNNPIYFFFKNDSTFSESIRRNSLTLLLHIYSVDRHSTEAWWENDVICLAEQTIDNDMYQALIQDASMDGLRWSIHWQQADLSLEVVIRWKTIDMPFLQPMTDDELHSLPFIPHAVIESTDGSPLDHHASSVIEATQYLELIDKLTDQLQQLQGENASLQEEKGYLKGQLDQQMQQIIALTSKNSIEHLESLPDLQALSKSDLIRKIMKFQEVLKYERGQKELYQQKVLTIQNELLSSNNSEKDFLALQDAHRSQQTLVKDLQRKVDKYYQCYETSMQQEKVIKQLEAIIAQQEKEKSKETEKKRVDKYSHFDESNEEQVPEILDRVNRLELIANTTHFNEANFAAVMEQSAAREHLLRENLRVMQETISQLKKENDRLKESKPRDEGSSRLNRGKRTDPLKTF